MLKNVQGRTGLKQIKGYKLFVFCFLATFLFAGNVKAKVTSLMFNNQQNISRLELKADENIEVEKTVREGGKQIILKVPGVELTEKWSRPLVTSQFPGNVVMMTPRPLETETGFEVVVQLRNPSAHRIRETDQGFVFEVEDTPGAFANSNTGSGENGLTGFGMDVPGQDVNGNNQEEGASDLGDAEEAVENRIYSGDPIDLNLSDAGIEQAVQLISQKSGFNIVFSQAASETPPVTIFLKQVPWDQALDTLLELNNLVAQKSGNVLNIRTYAEVTRQKEAEARAKQQVERAEPLITRIHKISYAKAEELQPIVEPYLTERGSIRVEKRTDSMVVVDINSVHDKVAKIVQLLDTQTPQILIESRIVEAKEDFLSRIGFNAISGNLRLEGSSAGDDNGILSISPVAGQDTAPSFGINFGRLTVSGIGVFENLAATLQLQEAESNAKIISSPRLITQNNAEATFDATDQRTFTVTAIGPEGELVPSVETVDLPTILRVVPKVTADGSIDLEIEVEKTTIGAVTDNADDIPTETRKIETRVLVENGGTVVLGGFYQNEKENQQVSGIPILKDLPLFGAFFRSPEIKQESTTELLVFITPKILNLEEAGLAEVAEIQNAAQRDFTDSESSFDDLEPLDSFEPMGSGDDLEALELPDDLDSEEGLEIGGELEDLEGEDPLIMESSEPSLDDGLEDLSEDLSEDLEFEEPGDDLDSLDEELQLEDESILEPPPESAAQDDELERLLDEELEASLEGESDSSSTSDSEDFGLEDLEDIEGIEELESEDPLDLESELENL
jgi:type IV pilus assembly protein PilQ